MAQRRTKRTLLCLEPVIDDLLQKEAAKEGKSPSEYVRTLLIKKFRDEELLTYEMFQQILL